MENNVILIILCSDWFKKGKTFNSHIVLPP
nr:MAG TPA: hypothetical protein [Caudoviricetes sp.]